MENRTAYLANNYYLPKKFGIDLRFSELSALVRSGQLSRKEAVERIAQEKPFDESILAEIKRRVGFSDAEWEAIMKAPLSHYTLHPTYKKRFERMRPFFYALYKAGYVTKSFYYKFCVLKDVEQVPRNFFESIGRADRVGEDPGPSRARLRRRVG